MKKKTRERLECELDAFEIRAKDAERKLHLCLGWIAAQHCLHPLANEVMNPGDEAKWGDRTPRDL